MTDMTPCDICDSLGVVGMSEKRSDYVAYLASAGVFNICNRCDGEEHWKYAQIRQEARRWEAHAGAVAIDSPPSLWSAGSTGGD